MVYFHSQPTRSRAMRWFRGILGAFLVTLIIFAITQVPYDILREERFRLYGEARAVGLVTEAVSEGPAKADEKFLIRYQYVDQDGLPRDGEAFLPRALWENFHPGSRVEVIYAPTRPGLARIPGEIEPPFQVWLRSILN